VPDYAPVDSLRADARSRTVCGGCKSATFVLWRLSRLSGAIDIDSIRHAEERRGITSFKTIWLDEEDPEARAGVIIRCAFFRMNVPDPFQIVDCEGFKKKANV